MGKWGSQEGHKRMKFGTRYNGTILLFKLLGAWLGKRNLLVGFSQSSLTPLNASGRGWCFPRRGWIRARGSEEGLQGACPKAGASSDLPMNDIQGVQGTAGTLPAKVELVEKGGKSAGQHGNMGAELLQEVDPWETTPTYLVR